MGNNWCLLFVKKGWKSLDLSIIRSLMEHQLMFMEDLGLSQHSGNLCRELLERVGHKIIFIFLQAVHVFICSNYFKAKTLAWYLVYGSITLRLRITDFSMSCFFGAKYLSGLNDRHWNPIHRQCNLCHTNYDFILKLETLEADEDVLFQHLNISDLLKHEKVNRWPSFKEKISLKSLF